MIVKCAHTDLVDLDLLVPNPRNTNKHSAAQIKLLAKIMNHQGWRNPIVVSTRSGFMTKGHARLEAARLNGWTQAPVDRQHYLTEADELADMIADNKIAELAESDEMRIQGIAMELGDSFDFDLFGIPDFRITGIDQLDPEKDQDEIPAPPKVAKTKPGDLYTLGRHRLLCGDATNLSDFQKLMGGEMADMVWTDPPYNVAYEGKTKESLTIQNDSMTDDMFYKFLFDAYTNLFMSTKEGGSIYVAHADSEGVNFRKGMIDAGWMLKQCLIWVKQTMVMGRQDYHWRHEPILYGWKPGAAHTWETDRKQTTVLEFDRPFRNEEHPTMKPVDLIYYMITNSSRKGHIVLDCFGGSGSTLVACEKAQRRANLLELDPIYCDVIVKRWETLTGERAVLTGVSSEDAAIPVKPARAKPKGKANGKR